MRGQGVQLEQPVRRQGGQLERLLGGGRAGRVLPRGDLAPASHRPRRTQPRPAAHLGSEAMAVCSASFTAVHRFILTSRPCSPPSSPSTAAASGAAAAVAAAVLLDSPRSWCSRPEHAPSSARKLDAPRGAAAARAMVRRWPGRLGSRRRRRRRRLVAAAGGLSGECRWSAQRGVVTLLVRSRAGGGLQQRPKRSGEGARVGGGLASASGRTDHTE